MTRIGYFLASEEHAPRELIRQSRLAEQAGFEALWISDHFHPWLDEQGQSSFVWSVRIADGFVSVEPHPDLPRHFGQLAELVTEEAVGRNVPCGPDPQTHLQALQAYLDAGYDEVYMNQIGPDQDGFFSFYAEQVLPELKNRG